MSNVNLENRPQVGIGVMILQESKVLLGKRKGKHGAATYGWVGGHLEFGETFEGCIIREAQEECGIKIESSNLKFLCLNNIIAYNKHYVDITFVTEVGLDSKPKVLESNRVESWGWYDLDNLPSPLFKAAELAVKSYQSGIVYSGK